MHRIQAAGNRPLGVSLPEEASDDITDTDADHFLIRIKSLIPSKGLCNRDMLHDCEERHDNDSTPILLQNVEKAVGDVRGDVVNGERREFDARKPRLNLPNCIKPFRLIPKARGEDRRENHNEGISGD